MARRKKAKARWRRWLRYLALAVVGFVSASLLLVLPLRWVSPPTTAFMLQDASGREPLLHEWVDWPVLGTRMPLAVVASEDQRFADHFGFDLKAIQQSIDEQDARGYLRGASTVTQQTVKNLYLWPGRSLVRKGLEAWLTILAEACLSKQRILEIYLNVAEFGPGIYGVGAASRFYFGTSPDRLTDAQAALLAAVLPNPRRLRVDAPSDYVRQRQYWVMAQMQRLRREGWINRVTR